MSASEGERSRFRHISVITLPFFLVSVDCKTVRIFAYSSTHEQSNKRSGTRLKTESETRERRFFFLSPHTPARALRAYKTLSPRFTDFFTDFEKNPTFLQCIVFVTFPVTHFFSFL